MCVCIPNVTLILEIMTYMATECPDSGGSSGTEPQSNYKCYHAISIKKQMVAVCKIRDGKI